MTTVSITISGNVKSIVASRTTVDIRSGEIVKMAMVKLGSQNCGLTDQSDVFRKQSVHVRNIIVDML